MITNNKILLYYSAILIISFFSLSYNMDNTICLNLVEGSDTNLSGEFTNIVDANESLCNEERSQRFDDAYLSLNTNPMAFTLNKYEKIRS
jgi:hypothetical protein